MLKKIFFTHTLDFTTTTVRMANSLKKTSGPQNFFNYILLCCRSDPNIRVMATKFPLKRLDKGKGVGEK